MLKFKRTGGTPSCSPLSSPVASPRRPKLLTRLDDSSLKQEREKCHENIPCSPSSSDSSVEYVLPEKKLKKVVKKKLNRAKKEIEKQTSRRHKNVLSSSDFLSRQQDLKVWIQEHYNKDASKLSENELREYFKKYVKKWNRRQLAQKYYRGVDLYSSQLTSSFCNSVDTTEQSPSSCDGVITSCQDGHLLPSTTDDRTSPLYANKPLSESTNHILLAPSTFPPSTNNSSHQPIEKLSNAGKASRFATVGRASPSKDHRSRVVRSPMVPCGLRAVSIIKKTQSAIPKLVITEEKENSVSATTSQTAEQTDGQTTEQTDGQTDDQTGNQTDDQTDDQTSDQTDDQRSSKYQPATMIRQADNDTEWTQDCRDINKETGHSADSDELVDRSNASARSARKRPIWNASVDNEEEIFI